MEQKILDFAEEKFRYEYPRIRFYPERLIINTGTGAQFSGSFKVQLGEGRRRNDEKIRGYFTCLDHRMKIEPLTFSAEEEMIHFTYDTSYRNPEEVFSGSIFLISSHGEFELPYSVEPSLQKIYFQEEEISKMDDFVRIVKEDRKAALSIFLDKNFDRIFLKENKEASLIRRGLLFSTDKLQALEEFLCYLGMKDRVELSFDKKEYDFHLTGNQVRYKIFLRKNTWGYFKAKLDCPSPAIYLSKNEITDKDFHENLCEIELGMKQEYLEEGSSHIEITVSDFRGSAKLAVNLIPMEGGAGLFLGSRKNVDKQMQAIRDFYRYRSENASKKEMVTSIRTLLRSFGEEKRDELLYLQAYLDWLDGEKEKVLNLLSENERWEKTPLAGALHLYFKYLFSEEKEKQGLKNRMEELAKNFGVMEAYLFILKMEERFIDSDTNTFELLAKLHKAGVNKIFLFLETWLLLSKSPELFRKLDSFMEKMFIKAIRYGLPIEEELKKKYIEFSLDLREYNPLVFCTLVNFYDGSDGKLALEAIISQLLKADKRYPTSLIYLKKGIQKGIKLTGIYELYAKSLKEGDYIEPSVYTYFLFGNSLPKSAKSILYSYLMEHKKRSEYVEIYKKYEKKLEDFALEELRNGEINAQNLVLFKEFIKDRNFVEKAGETLSGLIYKVIIRTEKESAMTEVLVLHEGFEKPISYKFSDGIAFADKLREEAIYLFSDKEGRLFLPRRTDLEELFRYEVHTNSLFQKGDKNLLTALQLYREGKRNKSEQYYLACEALMQAQQTEETYRKKAKKEMISYLEKENDQGRLEVELTELDLRAFEKKDGRFLAEVIFRNDLEGHFYQAARYSGIQNLSRDAIEKLIFYVKKVKKPEFYGLLLEAAPRMIKENIGEDSSFLWLSEKLEAPVPLLLSLMRRLIERKIDSPLFREKLFEQLLFTEHIPKEGEELLFASLDGLQEELRRAFLSFYYYRWLVKEEELPDFIKKTLSEEVLRANTLLPVISYLKVLSRKESLSAEEKEFASMRLLRLVEDGIILPFFKDFLGKCKLPAEIENLKFAYCYADATDEIEIQYKFAVEGKEESSQMTKEWMKNVYLGIFVKQFLIFADERIKYYISCQKDEKEEIIKNEELFIDPEDLLAEDGKKSLYAEINRIFLARYVDDKKALSDYMKAYLLQRETLKDIFTFQFLEEDGR